jgi:hypothetical protein
MPGGPSVPIALPNPTTSSRLVAQAGVTTLPEDSPSKIPSISGLAGWEIDETSGSAGARFRLWDGTAAGGSSIELADVAIGAGQTSPPPPSNPLEVSSGAIYLEMVSGSIAGVVQILL